MEKIWTIKDILDWLPGYFKEKGIGSARLDAEILLSFTLKKKDLISI